MKFPKIHDQILDNSVMVSGIFRSGTTLLGKLLGSLRGAEYAFEPPLVFHLDYLLQSDEMDADICIDILRTHLSEDIMLNYQHGRGYNMRPGDDSSIYHMKSKDEIESKWNSNGRAKSSVDRIGDSMGKLIFKSPATYSIIMPIMRRYPNIKVVEITRDLRSVFNSIKAKKWFNSEVLAEDYPPFYPFFQDEAGLYIPYYMPEEVKKKWSQWSEEDRIIKVLEILTNIKNKTEANIMKNFSDRFINIRFEELIKNKEQTLGKISNFLGMKNGTKTENIMKSILKKDTPVDFSLDGCAEQSKKTFAKLNRSLGYYEV